MQLHIESKILLLQSLSVLRRLDVKKMFSIVFLLFTFLDTLFLMVTRAGSELDQCCFNAMIRRYEETEQTLIRLLREQSAQGLHCQLIHLYAFDALLR